MRVLQIRVKPNARQSRLEQQADGSWLAQLRAAPVEGMANAELIALVAAHFKLRRSQVSIRSGASSRVKRVQLDATDD